MSVRKTETIICLCERCGHEWAPSYYRNDPNSLITPPIICPKCKNPYWNLPRVRLKKKDVVENV
jgi:DNA-directed RNA polymerase subunit M/transcription elongation factor TFIIS